MKLSIIVPAHNEERYIAKTLEQVFAIELPGEKEVVVVNDGSTDNTKNILADLAKNYNFKLREHDKNQGKGAAIKTGLEIVTGNLIIIQDADLEYSPRDIPALLSAINENISAVYGMRNSKIWSRTHYVLGARILTSVINILYGVKLRDTYTGYKLFNLNKIDLNLLKNLISTGFEFEAEVTCKILRNKGYIAETPISYYPRNKKEGKHIGPKDAFRGLWTILKCRFFY